ncbi:MAG TPA: acylneuraminate cytidylyltransferase family protein [Bacteroidales bacterium]|nr:acylneuraminate cytidylyltransferase family protein [Bacteroidales bacterium]
MKLNDTLFIIPARGGSKGLPRKNILPLGGKPLICHSIDAARGLSDDSHICLSTDDAEIGKAAEDYGLTLPFVRPPELSGDTAGSREVMLHALDFYRHQLGRSYARICLLQPTSPLRQTRHIEEALQLWQDDLDMVVSVRESSANPYFNLFEEEGGYLKKSKSGNYIRRQDAPPVWEYNGAIYLIRTAALQNFPIAQFKKVRKYVMSRDDSVDLDTELDYRVLQQLFAGKTV